MVGCGFVEPAIVVIEDDVFALVSHYIRDAPEVTVVLGDDESARIVSEHHSRSVNEATLIVNRFGVLPGAHRNVREYWPLLSFTRSARPMNTV